MPTIYYNWDVPSDDDYVKDTAAYMRTLGNDIDATLWDINAGTGKVGMHLLVNQSFTSVTFINVDNIFNGTYNNYAIKIDGTSAAATDINLQLRSNGTTNTTNYAYLMWGNTYASTAIAVQGGVSAGSMIVGRCEPQGGSTDISLHSPFLTTRTYGNAQFADYALTRNAGFVHDNTSSFTGFRISTSQNFTGNIRVYGLRNN